MFEKILVANRGEIAVRVIRACHLLGIKAVAVYSDVDRLSQHVLLADEAYPIGPAPASESYLRGDKIIDVALSRGAQAIHPGYGFLSENADFAQQVTDAGLTWIGPPPSAIASMGSKTQARSIMQKAGVPVVPGSPAGIERDEEAKKTAEKIGYPVLIKAAMGGGGKGMRVVHEPDELINALEGARRESLAAFSSPLVYLEKYIERPRHIEIQVFADHHGNVIHLGERECSIQRRHQKVVEESPSAVVTPKLREQMGSAAVDAAKACGYQNAGTVEFLVDPDLNFYFLEMNTRLQVEHPVTEMVTGIDLVQLQIRSAAGEVLPYKQEDIRQRGHAIEFRVYSEDSLGNFLPSTGTISYPKPPDGFGIREDSGVSAGGKISIHYDPMISKLVVWGKDRPEAIDRMKRALTEYRIAGLRTTIPFGIFVMNNESFRKGEIDTGFVAREFDAEVLRREEERLEKIIALAVAWSRHTGKDKPIAQPCGNGKAGTSAAVLDGSNWKRKGREKLHR
ncbi:acetyl-CoA carboxylase biotin carboxylase subunit [bacterium]|nr:acetyl-CoA carboxylase biotin carboxylase subunit [bacterium]